MRKEHETKYLCVRDNHRISTSHSIYGWMNANSVWEFENFLLTSSCAEFYEHERSLAVAMCSAIHSGSKNCAKAAQTLLFLCSQTFMHNKILLCAQRVINRFQWSLLFRDTESVVWDECLIFRGLLNWFYSLSRMSMFLKVFWEFWEQRGEKRELVLWCIEGFRLGVNDNHVE